MRSLIVLLIAMVFFSGKKCGKDTPPEPRDELIAEGRELFFNETFDGNGRTCGTCHPASNNFTLDSTFIAALPADDPLFVAERNPDLKENFEKPGLMRQHSLILENLDGFEEVENVFVMRGIPHTLGLSMSVNSAGGPMTGWSGDGAPGDRSLRSFATGAVIQHFTLSMNRVPGVDFRLPTEEELDALDAFQLSLGRQQDLELPLPLKEAKAASGQAIFNNPTTGKCFACHFNAGAVAAPAIFGDSAGNMNFNTGVENLPEKPGEPGGDAIPPDDGFGIPGNGEFNIPSLVEAADTGPFFHNNSVKTIEGSVDFYNSDAFNNSPAGRLIQNATGSGINLDSTQVDAVTAFLRVINVLENIRQGSDYLVSYAERDYLGNFEYEALPGQASEEIEDAVMILEEGGLHTEAVSHLGEAVKIIRESLDNDKYKDRLKAARKANEQLNKARALIVESS